jgi:polyvinyl alcohol dehydrogenase (cytochrome)
VTGGRVAARGVAISALLTGLIAAGFALPGAAQLPADAGRIGGGGGAECVWPMWGRDLGRTFSTPCSGLTPQNAKDLRRIWFFNAHDVVTATPAVVGDTVYVGDWSGRFYALDTETGEQRWMRKTKVHPNMYAGQIVSSAAVETVGGTETVYFGGGKTLYALEASDGSVRWKHELNPKGGADDPTEIESSPLIVDGPEGKPIVVVGWDVHNSTDGEPAGVFALDAATGDEVWTTVLAPTDEGPNGEPATGPGCADVWSSPTVDEERALVFVGTGNCVTSPEGYGRFAEAVVALDLMTGDVRWSYQPHQPNRDDLDFAGAPNLFESTGPDGGVRALVGLGGKDGTYYALDRETGELVWTTPVVGPGLTNPGSNFSTGGFIGPTAVADGVITGGTAIGDNPYLHALDTATGAIKWQQPIAAATYGAPGVGGGVVVIGGTDFTMRALDLATGEVLWSDEVYGAVSGGPAIIGDDVFAVAGIREPGLSTRSRTSGVYRYSLSGKPLKSATTPPKSASSEPGDTRPDGPTAPQECVESACEVSFNLVEPPAGLSPRMQLRVDLDPWRVVVKTEGLGDPAAWLRPGSAAEALGATRFGVFISESDDNPQGGLLCILDAEGSCTSKKIPRAGATYNRITVLAVTDSDELPSPAEGVDRLMVTKSFDPPLAPVAAASKNKEKGS